MTMIQKYMLEEYQKATETKCVCGYAKADIVEKARDNHIAPDKGCKDCWQLELQDYEVDKEKWKEFVDMMLGGD